MRCPSATNKLAVAGDIDIDGTEWVPTANVAGNAVRQIARWPPAVQSCFWQATQQ